MECWSDPELQNHSFAPSSGHDFPGKSDRLKGRHQGGKEGLFTHAKVTVNNPRRGREVAVGKNPEDHGAKLSSFGRLCDMCVPANRLHTVNKVGNSLTR
jgi:hypothetical protein